MLTAVYIITYLPICRQYDSFKSEKNARYQFTSIALGTITVKAMLHEAISLATCKKKFTCNTPFCNCNCCVASCKKPLYFSQRCQTSCLRVTSPLQLATQFCQNGPIRAHLSQNVGDLARPPSCLLLYALQVAKKVANV